MPCGGPKRSPRTSSIVWIIFSFWFFDISEGILKNQKSSIGLDSFSLFIHYHSLYLCFTICDDDDDDDDDEGPQKKYHHKYSMQVQKGQLC